MDPELWLPDPTPWTMVGGPSPGTVSALAIGLRQGVHIFAGTRAGLYRTKEPDGEAGPRWQRLPAAPLEIISLGVSPTYAEDCTIIAGTAQGLFISRDCGESWRAARTPMPDPVVLCVCFSPNYRADGIILAGTLEDGIYYTDTWGERWSFRGIGMLDAAVYALAISPDFAHDELIFAGTETALYYSYNAARAWKPLDFPEDLAPILSLALSPAFPSDHTIYAGTERHGLYRSVDLGKTWQKQNLPVTCVNALAISPQRHCLFAATNSGLYSSAHGDESWTCLLDRPDVFSLAVKDDLLIAGLANQGAWSTNDMANWRPFFTLPARSLTGMALSPRFDSDPVGFLWGSQEGIWRTVNAGLSWTCLNEGLPSLDIRAMALSPTFPQDRVLVAASGDGLLISQDAGEHWSWLENTSATHVAFSPRGKFLVSALSEGEIRMATVPKGPWQSMPTAWKRGEVLALAVDDNCQLRVAVLDRAGESVAIWAGLPGEMKPLLERAARATPLVAFWDPPYNESGRTWYISLDHQVWELPRLPGESPASANLVFEVPDGSRIVSLTGSQTPNGPVLFACTGQTIYKSLGAKSWTAVHYFGDQRAISLVLSPGYSDDHTAFALLLGGAFCRGVL
jgi:photosystem II stability/assembly factor-like uncharacterized protein